MVADNVLKSTSSYGPTAGFDNMLSKENERWWNLKSIVVKIVVWTLILNVIVVATMYFIPMLITPDVKEQLVNSSSEQTRQMTANGYFDFTPDKVASLGMSMFFNVAGFAIFIGAVIYGHDAILKERESGTAAWLLSKPVSRKAFVLSKILAIGFGIITLILLMQGLITYILCSLVQGSPMPLLPFLAGLSILGLGILFYIVLAIALGVFSLSRVVTLGVPIIIGLLGSIILTVTGGQGYFDMIGYVMPWKLMEYSALIAAGNTVTSDHYWPWPIVATVAFIIVFIIAAVEKFERLEL